MTEETHARMRISREGVDGLAEAARHMRKGAEHLEAAHRLLLELREAGELSMAVDLVEGVPDA